VIAPGKAHVGYDNVNTAFVQCRASVSSIVGEDAGMAARLKHVANDDSDLKIVLDQENVAHRLSKRCYSGPQREGSTEG
jgi:hypothetical protein